MKNVTNVKYFVRECIATRKNNARKLFIYKINKNNIKKQLFVISGIKFYTAIISFLKSK